ncbi:MAG: 16S rRNA (uracil(1498)-N(3))-methyltransferase [Geobacteraceae bacterium]|nr:16S rRNA (uracil(1498)-N(3))-methyltransferase [Geobacteraceae bacterium]
MNLVLLYNSEEIVNGRVLLQGRRAQHIRTVLRAQAGESVRVGLLQGNMGTGRILRLNEDSVELEVELHNPPPAPDPTTLILALPRPKVLKRLLVMLTTRAIPSCPGWN